jgi:hypothetical protein
MSRYKKGDIVICVTDKMYGMTYLLEVGEQYRIDDFLEMSEKNLVNVSKVTTGEFDPKFQIGQFLFDDKHFIPMDVWRKFQLRKILE